MILENLFPINEKMGFVFSQPSIFLLLVVFSIVKIASLFAVIVILENFNLKNKYKKALFLASGTEGLNFILKSAIVLNFLNIAARLEESTGVGLDRIIFVPTLLAMLFSIYLVRKTYSLKDGGAVFWYVWLVSGTLILLVGDIALVLLLLTF